MVRVPRLLVAGDPRHGVVRFARELADAVAAQLGEAVEVSEPGSGTGSLHVQFTDRLWGASPEAAADALCALAAVRPLTVTLHDLPQASDGPTREPRRAAAYARVAAAARGVGVTSEHEAALLRDVAPAVAATVIGHPLRLADDRSRPTRLVDEVGILGFFYPGKGHAEAVAAVAALHARDPSARGLGVRVLGMASPGHADELAALRRDAERRGVGLEVTGYLGDDALGVWSRRVAVPLCGHRHVSASGSTLAWVAAGRRPLVVEGRYFREQAAARPGTLTLVAPAALPDAIAAARATPDSTWWGADAVLAPDDAQAAREHLAWWAETVAW